MGKKIPMWQAVLVMLVMVALLVCADRKGHRWRTTHRTYSGSQFCGYYSRH